jgi:FKBP-type peptidyl-prolyl cis-trans isomerase
MVEQTCKKYNIKVKNYIKSVCFKEFLYKLFIHMMEYNIDSKLIFMMKDLIIINQDIAEPKARARTKKEEKEEKERAKKEEKERAKAEAKEEKERAKTEAKEAKALAKAEAKKKKGGAIDVEEAELDTEAVISGFTVAVTATPRLWQPATFVFVA